MGISREEKRGEKNDKRIREKERETQRKRMIGENRERGSSRRRSGLSLLLERKRCEKRV